MAGHGEAYQLPSYPMLPFHAAKAKGSVKAACLLPTKLYPNECTGAILGHHLHFT